MYVGNDDNFPIIKPFLLKDKDYLDMASIHLSGCKNMLILKFIVKMFPKLYYPTVHKDDFVTIAKFEDGERCLEVMSHRVHDSRLSWTRWDMTPRHLLGRWHSRYFATNNDRFIQSDDLNENLRALRSIYSKI